jgi:hypothetical protein
MTSDGLQEIGTPPRNSIINSISKHLSQHNNTNIVTTANADNNNHIPHFESPLTRHIDIESNNISKDNNSEYSNDNTHTTKSRSYSGEMHMNNNISIKISNISDTGK